MSKFHNGDIVQYIVQGVKDVQEGKAGLYGEFVGYEQNGSRVRFPIEEPIGEKTYREEIVPTYCLRKATLIQVVRELMLEREKNSCLFADLQGALQALHKVQEQLESDEPIPEFPY